MVLINYYLCSGESVYPIKNQLKEKMKGLSTVIIILLVVIIILGGWYIYHQKNKGFELPINRRKASGKVRFNDKVKYREYPRSVSNVDVDEILQSDTDENESVSKRVSRYLPSPRLQDLSEESTGTDESVLESEIVGADDNDDISIWEKAFDNTSDKESKKKYGEKLKRKHLKHQKAESDFVKYQTDHRIIQTNNHDLRTKSENNKGMTIGEIYDRRTSKPRHKNIHRSSRKCESDSQYDRSDFSDDF
jgi:hypothetical protein